LPLKVFISSIFDELGPEREIAADIVRRIGLQPQWWEDQPAGNDRPPERLKQLIDDSDSFILIVWKDIHGIVKWEYDRAFDRGIPRFVFVKQIPKKMPTKRLARFLDGAPTYRPFSHVDEFKREVRRTLLEWISTFTNPFLRISYSDLQRRGTTFMEEPSFRVIDMPAVATILTGPRPFGEPSSDPGDIEMFGRLSNLRKRSAAGEIKYYTGTNLALTKQALKNVLKVNKRYRMELIKRLDEFQKQTTASNSKFRFACEPPTETRHFQSVVVDNKFAIWWEDFVHTGMYIWTSGEDAHIAKGIEELYNKNCTLANARRLQKELGLI